MKVLLIEPPFYLFQNIQPGSASLGLAMLAAMADREGHNVKIFSPDFELVTIDEGEKVITKYENVHDKTDAVKERLNEIINSFHPEVVGISFWTARANAGIELARHIKGMYSNITVIAGGIHATILPDELLKSGVIDFIIRGEGEFAFIALLESLATDKDPKKEHIDCLSFIDKSGRTIHNPIKYCQNLDELPFPGYEHFINYEKFNKNAFQSVMVSRGCPFHCNYCASHMLWTRKVRYHSPIFVFRMIKHINQKFGTDYYRFDDDTFTLNKRLVHDICQLFKKRQLPIKWHCDTRVEFVSHELLSKMKEVGLETVAMGVESGDVTVRKLIRKTSTLEETKKAFKIAAELGINTVGYFMIGFPGETYEQASKTLDLIEEMCPTIPCISICIPYPGTDSFQLAVQMDTIKGYDSIDWSKCYHHSNINFSGKITNNEWENLLARCTKIEQEACERRNTQLRIHTMKQLSIKKRVHSYIKKPYVIITDIYDLVSLFFSIIIHRFRT